MLSFVLPLAAVVIAGVWFVVALRPIGGNPDERVTVVIPPGSGVRDVSTLLESEGLIRNRFAFELAVGLAGLSGDLQAGTFELAPTMSATAMARELAAGSAAKEVSLIIREGWTAQEIGQYLESQKIGTRQDFVAAARTYDSRTILPNDQFPFLIGRPATAALEGYLFPDTYRVYPDATSVEVIRKMLENFGKRINEQLQSEVRQSGRSLYEIVTLASIIEREVRTDRDRRLVADIFWRRIAAGIPLQSDATVNYVTGKNQLQPSIADTEVESPYNTYRNRGLPPGPIGNPGLSSIMAAIRPEPNSDLFFLTDRDGGVHYAKTFDEHLQNKARYLP